MRLPAEQTSPWLKNTPNSAPSTATSKSASAKKMFGDLPPSSSEIFFSVAAALRMIVLPTSALPVKAILSTPGCSTIAAPVAPSPLTMLTTPDGRPASAKLEASSRIDNGVCSAGFSTVVQPAQIAGASFQAAILRGGVLPLTGIERGACRGDGVRHVGGVGIRHAGEQIPGRRIDDLEGRRRLGVDELAVHVQVVAFQSQQLY